MPAGTKPEDSECQRKLAEALRKKLRETCGFIFAGLTEEKIEDRLAFYLLPAVQDPSNRLDEVLSNKERPMPAEEKVFELVVPMLQEMLRAECKRQERKDGKGNREAIADLADSIVEKLSDAARGGETWGEQHARVLHRHPFALSDALSLPNDSPLSVKEANDRMGSLREFEVVREIENLKLEFEKILPSMSEREQKRKRDELCTMLIERYPELESLLKDPVNLIKLTPELVARIVWGRRQTPVIDEKTVSNFLGDMNDRILQRTSPSQWIKKHPEDFET